MFKKTITYTDFNNNERTEDFYFNLTQAEALSIQLSAEGNNFQQQIQKIAAEMDGAKIIQAFKDIIAAAYGEKSLDGRSFHKTEDILERFTSTEAYSKLFMELATDADAAAVFVNGIAPKGMDEQAAKIQQSLSARERSEAQMQGYKKPQAPEPQTVNEPVQIPTAAPQLDAQPTPTETPLDDAPTFEDFQAWKAAQKNAQ